MVLDEPLEQFLAFAAKFVVDAWRAVLHELARFAHLFAHLLPVAYRHADVGKHLQDLRLVPAELVSKIRSKHAFRRIDAQPTTIRSQSNIEFAEPVQQVCQRNVA